MISDFLGGLSDDYKAICLRWIEGWLENFQPWSKVLADLLPALRETRS